jgi:hypothetical protein
MDRSHALPRIDVMIRQGRAVQGGAVGLLALVCLVYEWILGALPAKALALWWLLKKQPAAVISVID